MFIVIEIGLHLNESACWILAKILYFISSQRYHRMSPLNINIEAMFGQLGNYLKVDYSQTINEVFNKLQYRTCIEAKERMEVKSVLQNGAMFLYFFSLMPFNYLSLVRLN